MGSVEWKFRYDIKQAVSSQSAPALNHPLLPKSLYYVKAIVDPGREVKDKYEFSDPLGATEDEPENSLFKNNIELNDVEYDKRSIKRIPLLDNTLEMKQADNLILDIELPNFEPWRNKRQQILDNFSTGEKLTITSSFLMNDATRRGPGDRTQRRLQVLEDLSGLRKLSELSQAEFVMHVNELRELLIVAWNNNKRVEAIRLVTELTRMLSITSNATFYPYQWVLVTDIIELFGKLVYERLLTKANEERRSSGMPNLSHVFTSEDILESATEIAKNWFCKIADIKELIPRFYVETSLIACMRFLDSSSLRVNLLRLASMPHKLNNNLLSAYCWAFISKMSMSLDATNRAVHWKCLNDWLQSPIPSQPNLIWPALEWVVQCVSFGATTTDDIAPLWEYCKQPDKQYIVRCFLNSVAPSYLANHALDIVPIVLKDDVHPVHICTFGERLLLAEVSESIRPQILRSIWKGIGRIPDVVDFLKCCVVWSKFTSKYFTIIEVTRVSESIVKRMFGEKLSEKHLELLVSCVADLVAHSDFIKLMQSDHFSILIDWLRDEPYASQCAKYIITGFIHAECFVSPDDFTISNYVLNQCATLSRSLKPDTHEDEVRLTSHLICAALDKFSVTTSNYQRVLTWLVESRAALSELQLVNQHISSKLIHFGLLVNKQIRDSSKKANFLRACIANLFVTIPSLENPNTRIRFTMQAVQIGLLANSLPQTDALMKQCVEYLDQLPAENEFLHLSSTWLALLVNVPDSPNKPILHLFNAFLNVIMRKDIKNSSLLTNMWLICLQYLWSVAQEDFRSPFGHLITNDLIYGSSSDYKEVIREKTAFVMDRLLEIVELEDTSISNTSLALLEIIISRFHIENQVGILVSNLLKRSLRLAGEADQRRVKDVVRDIVSLATYNDNLSKLVEKYDLKRIFRRSHWSTSMDPFSDDDFMDLDPFSDDEETQPPIESTTNVIPANVDIKETSFDNDASNTLANPQQLLAQKKFLDKISADLEMMVTQLRFALELSKQLEMCSSDVNLPIRSTIRPHLLDSGCLLLILELTNSSRGELCDWYATVNLSQLRDSSTERGSPCLNISRNIPIDRLESSQSYSTEICVAAVDISLPVICNVHLMKSFTFDSVTRVVGLDLSDILVSSINHLQTLPHDEDLELLRGNFQIILPSAFVHLILNGDKDEDPSKLLQLIRNEFSSDKEPAGLTAVLTRLRCAPRISQSSHLIRISVECDSSYLITVHAKDPDIRSRIRNDLHLFFVVIASRLSKTSKDYLHSDPDFRSVEQLFDSIISRFR